MRGRISAYVRSKLRRCFSMFSSSNARSNLGCCNPVGRGSSLPRLWGALVKLSRESLYRVYCNSSVSLKQVIERGECFDLSFYASMPKGYRDAPKYLQANSTVAQSMSKLPHGLNCCFPRTLRRHNTRVHSGPRTQADSARRESVRMGKGAATPLASILRPMRFTRGDHGLLNSMLKDTRATATCSQDI